MSASSGSSPLLKTGTGYVLQRAPSLLVARYSSRVAQLPATFAGYKAQYSESSGIHCTSRCHGMRSPLRRATDATPPQLMPFAERRSSTEAFASPHPSAPPLTLHISQSVALRRTIVG